MSTFVISNSMTVDRQTFLERCEQGLKDRYGDPLPQEALDRFERELILIEQHELSGALYIASEFAAEARRKGVYVAPCPNEARCLVTAFTLRISDIDPLAHGLTPECFFSPWNFLSESLDSITVQLESGPHRGVSRSIEKRFGEDAIKTEVSSVTKGYSTSTLVSCDQDPGTTDIFDTVGLRHLQSSFDRMAALCHLVEERTGLSADPADIPLDDEAAFELLRSGDVDDLKTLVRMRYNGFGPWSDSQEDHIGKDARRLAKIHPEGFSDLVFFSSNIDPDDDGASLPCRRTRPRFCDDCLNPILKDTRGYFAYEEQTLAVLEKVGGFSPDEARIMLAAFDYDLEKHQELFEEEWCRRAMENGFSPDFAKRLWDGAGSGTWDTKSGRVSDAVCLVRTAYLKAHFPEVWAEAGLG